MPNISHSASDAGVFYREKGQWTMACKLTVWLFLSQASFCTGLLITPDTLPNFQSNLLQSPSSTQYSPLWKPLPLTVPPHSAPTEGTGNMRQGWDQLWRVAIENKEPKYVLTMKMIISLYEPAVHRTQRLHLFIFVAWQPCPVCRTEWAFSYVCWIADMDVVSSKSRQSCLRSTSSSSVMCPRGIL